MQNHEHYDQMLNMLQANEGALIPLKRFAELVHTSPESLANVFRRTQSAKMKLLSQNRRRFGRKVFFPTPYVAAFFAFEEEEFQRYMEDSHGTNASHNAQ